MYGELMRIEQLEKENAELKAEVQFLREGQWPGCLPGETKQGCYLRQHDGVPPKPGEQG